jgi:AraC-like DNA-binding protein
MVRHLPGTGAPVRQQDVGIVSVIPARLRSQCDAVVSTQHRTVHADSATEALAALRTTSPHFLLLAPSILRRDSPHAVRELIDRSTGAITVAVVGDGPPAHRALMELGAAGVRRCLDVSERDAWPKLREMISQAEGKTAATILRRVMDEIAQMTPDLRHFLEVLIYGAPRASTVRVLAPAVGVRVTTLVSRFVRAGLPTPKQYLVATRLLYVAAMFDEERMTVGAVAYRLRYASPQSLGRHLRLELGITPSEFRARHPFNAWLDRYIATVVGPFVTILRTFDPVRANESTTRSRRACSAR